MLLSFRVSNHRSLREEQELHLRPVYDKERLAVPVAAIFGANAAGKSNVLDALSFMRSAVLHSHARWDPHGGIPRRAFKLDPASLVDASGFAVDLLLDGVRYAYGFTVDDERVREEWLYTYPKGRRRMLLERKDDEFEFGPTLTGPKRLVAEATRPNSLCLTTGVQSRLKQFLPVYDWFHKGLRFADQEGRAWRRKRTIEMLSSSGKVGQIMDLLRAADLGITAVLVEEESESPEELTARTDALRAERLANRARIDQTLVELSTAPDEERRRALNEELRSLESRSTALTQQIFDLRERLRRPPKIFFLHGDPSAPFEFEEESRGTQALFDLLGLALEAVGAGAALVVDEIGTSLHPHLTAQLVNLFRNREANPKGAQLIFTTHDATLLGPLFGEEVLARDEIWFIEKGRDGASTLYPLTDFHPRKVENRERRYLGGAYGAVPFLNEEDFVAAVIGRREAGDRG